MGVALHPYFHMDGPDQVLSCKSHLKRPACDTTRNPVDLTRLKGHISPQDFRFKAVKAKPHTKLVSDRNLCFLCIFFHLFKQQ